MSEEQPVVQEPQAEVKQEVPVKPELTPEQKAQMEKQKTFFEKIRLGGYFIQFVREDLARQKAQQLNRTQRRRFDKELRKGEFSPELINHYVAKMDLLVEYYNEKLNPKPAVDGTDFYAEAKKLEAEGKLNPDGSVKEENINTLAQ